MACVWLEQSPWPRPAELEQEPLWGWGRRCTRAWHWLQRCQGEGPPAQHGQGQLLGRTLPLCPCPPGSAEAEQGKPPTLGARPSLLPVGDPQSSLLFLSFPCGHRRRAATNRDVAPPAGRGPLPGHLGWLYPAYGLMTLVRGTVPCHAVPRCVLPYQAGAEAQPCPVCAKQWLCR